MAQRMQPRLILIPGLGCDARLWDPLRQRGLVIDTPPWLAPQRGETLAAYGRRFAAAMPIEEPYFLGGASLGGFLAMEVAQHEAPRGRLRGLFLIATATSGLAVRASIRRLEPWLGWLPAPLFKPAAALAIGSTLRAEPLSAAQLRLLLQMAAQAPARFVRWAALAVPRWHFSGLEQLACPVHQIHGRHDRLIPLGPMTPQVVLDDGGHLISLTHAQEVARFLRRGMHS